jgi:hypothetical protein
MMGENGPEQCRVWSGLKLSSKTRNSSSHVDEGTRVDYSSTHLNYVPLFVSQGAQAALRSQQLSLLTTAWTRLSLLSVIAGERTMKTDQEPRRARFVL